MKREHPTTNGDLELKDPAHYDTNGTGQPHPGLTSEKAILIEKHHRVSAKTAVKLRVATIAISWVSVIVSFLLGTCAIAFAWIFDSQSLFGFGIDALLDCISSCIIVWRFHKRDAIYGDREEIRACIAIGTLFIISSSALAAKSIYALLHGDSSEKPDLVLILSAVNFVLCLVLGISKIVLGYRLESRALITDSIITLVGCIMSLFTLIFSLYYTTHPKYWYIDNAFGIACAIFLLCYGIRVLVVSIADLRELKDAGKPTHM